jgi:hypothetical protein
MSETQELDLDTAAGHLLEECRMVLPGIQALFGFQLIAVFSDGFHRELTINQQRLHVGAVLCVVVAIALVMAPAAIHRRREQRSVSSRFLSVSSALLMFGMIPLAIGTVLDVYLVAIAVLHDAFIAGCAATIAAAAFIGLWWFLPTFLRLESSPPRPKG